MNLRFPQFNSLKTGILIYLTFLVVSAMLLINVVMIKLTEKNMINERLTAGRMALCLLQQEVKERGSVRRNPMADLKGNHAFRFDMEQLLRTVGIDGALFVDNSGEDVLEIGQCTNKRLEMLALAHKALHRKKEEYIFSGRTWGVIWPGPEQINISGPLIFSGHIAGGVTICVTLREAYKKLRRAERIVLVYIFLNAIVLIFIGSYLISRMVLGPVKRLLRATEDFREGDFLPDLAGSPGNEIGQLSRSLNLMLRRLEENKMALETHIASLRKANRELQTAQKEMIRTERMASVGRLTAGIAHEIGNPVTIILGYLELLRSEGLDRIQARDFLERIEWEITRVRHIIKQLVDFSRPSDNGQIDVNVHELVMETVEIVKPRFRKSGIGLDLKLKATRDVVYVDPDQLRQAFLNIVMNALDAMKDADGANILTIESANHNDYLELRFSDTGPGIPDDELAHIFDPFYTTKEAGEGPGLGLWVCHSIIDGLGGTIRAESSAGQGVAIVIELPIVSG